MNPTCTFCCVGGTRKTARSKTKVGGRASVEPTSDFGKGCITKVIFGDLIDDVINTNILFQSHRDQLLVLLTGGYHSGAFGVKLGEWKMSFPKDIALVILECVYGPSALDMAPFLPF